MDVDRVEDLSSIPNLPTAPAAPPSPPRPITVKDLDFKTDLLALFSKKEDALVPLSPSAAETLMVSPFAWLLRRIGCEPKEWAVDAFDVMTAGTLAHRVFEEIYQPGARLPTEAQIKKRVPAILRKWALQIAPFLRSPDWRVERFKFESDLLKAAVHWMRLLKACKADIVATEQWLRGAYGDVPLHGQSDLLLRLPDGKLLVVDYKKSSSTKRRERMRNGFDLQAHLYRLMIQTGGLADLSIATGDIGIVYYLLNDTTALADSPVANDGSVPGWEASTGDASSQAMQHLDRRLSQIRQGEIRLNHIDDEDWWSEQAALPIYALDNSPLLRLFMHTEETAS